MIATSKHTLDIMLCIDSIIHDAGVARDEFFN